MRKIEDYLEKISYDPQTGHITRLVGKKAGQRADIIHPSGYMRCCVCGDKILAHRLAWACYYGEWPIGQIDHINGDRGDNRIENLRLVSSFLNALNKSKAKNNTSGHCGVSFCNSRGKWQAYIEFGGKKEHLGRYDTIQEAISARVAAQKALGFTERHGK